MKHRHARWAAISLCVAACSAGTTVRKPLAAGEGRVTVEGGRVWYKVSGTGAGTPLLMLHGGPGTPSSYLEPLEVLGDERLVIRYDQLGGGRSDHPADTALWRTERFVRELQALRDSLGLGDVILYGHSWGTMLAAAYLETKPAGVKGVVFASPALSAARWTHDADSLITFLPDSIQRAIAESNASGKYDTPDYQHAVGAYYARHLQRDTTAVITDTVGAGAGTRVYMHMWGPSEFRATGNLKAFDATPRLSEIGIPSLFMAGEFDEATPATTSYYAGLVRGSEMVVVPGAGHMTMIDNLDGTVRPLREWLRRIDRR
jgi:proline iminopeptidase